MLLYRVFAHDSSARAGEPGHEDYIHRPAQGSLRLDNPGSYVTWYYGATPEVAIVESFGDHGQWSDEMFETPYLPNGRRVLGVFEIDTDTPFLDLDDANALVDRSLRPTQIVSRTRGVTQAWALKVFREQNDDGERVWRGVKWWSWYGPQWTVYGTWTVDPEPPIHTLVEVQPLSQHHAAVRAAQGELARVWH